MRSARICLCAALGLLVAEAASSEDKERSALLPPPLWHDADDKSIAEPKERDISEIWDVARNTWLRHLDLGYIALKASDRPALNVNAWDEVPDSSWFVNRIGRREVSIDEFLEGAPGLPPVPGKWAVTRLKTEGYTPGVRIQDSAGQGFLLKLDLAAAPERNSAADRIGSLLMHAAGYYAPQNTIVTFWKSDLVLAEEARFEDALGRRRPMTENDLVAALANLAPREDGSFRALASHYLPGMPKGHFPYSGTRKDDPNELIPHELRRELRGLRVIASWFNHVDVKEVNNLDVFIKNGDGGHLRHYFIDFGSTLGSGDFMNGPKRVGHEYLYDGSAIYKSFLSFGAWERPWERQCRVVFPEVGHFEAELFDPARWKPNYPNLAFEEADASDAYWGAKIVTAFTDEHIRALASAGQYSRSEVRDYVEETLSIRRDKIGAHWFSVVSPLEAFELESADARFTLRFRDLGIERGYASAADRRYRFQVRAVGTKELLARGDSTSAGEVRFEIPVLPAPAEKDRFGRAPSLIVDLYAGGSSSDFALPVRIVLGTEGPTGELKALGWHHAPR